MLQGLDDTIQSVERVQNFDPAALVRREVLGASFSFEEAVDPARELIGLFKQIPNQHLGEINQSNLNQIRERANGVYKLFDDITKFDPKTDTNPTASRTNLIQSLKNQYNDHFQGLYQIIAFLSSRTRDFSALEQQARAAVQAAQDEAAKLKSQLAAAEVDAKRILDEIRRVAAEQGVSQQAIYFKNEADDHETKAKSWQKYTWFIASGLILFAGVSVFLPKWDFLKPLDAYEAIQLGLSKLLVFGVLAYMLFLCARTLLAHRHNAVVNRHRQNALLTFNALVEAARGEDRRDIVLSYAAGCIFSPQETGYTKSAATPAVPGTQLVEVLPKIVGNPMVTSG